MGRVVLYRLSVENNDYYTFCVCMCVCVCVYVCTCVRVYVCSFSYAAREAHALYFIVICGVSDSTIIFSTVSHKRYDYRKKLLHIKCVFRLSPHSLSEKFLILWRIQRLTIINENGSTCQVPVIPARFSWNLKFHENLSRCSRVVPFGKMQAGSKQTDMTKVTVAFDNFADVPKNSTFGSKPLFLC